MRELVFFHTARSNATLFEETAKAQGLTIPRRHVVREDLLAAAREAGTLTPELADRAAAAMEEARGDAPFLLCTCSTLGPAADRLAEQGAPVGRVDRALAAATFRLGDRCTVLVTMPSTVAATRELFRQAAAAAHMVPRMNMILVEGAQDLFVSGDLDDYHAAIADAIERIPASDGTIVLAQASMAPAAALTDREVLTSPETAIADLQKSTA